MRINLRSKNDIFFTILLHLSSRKLHSMHAVCGTSNLEAIYDLLGNFIKFRESELEVHRAGEGSVVNLFETKFLWL